MKKATLGMIGGTAGVLAAAALILYTPTIQTAPEPTTAPAVSVYESNGYAEAPPKPIPTPVEVPPVVVEETPAEPEPVEPVWGEYPSGYPIPYLPSPDPNVPEGGRWDVNACASSTGYTGSDGNQYCA